jgi:hypothetical protein
MNTLSKRDKTLKEIFIGNCWKYLHDNFHKFNEANKIKISLALAQKDMPTQMTGDLSFTQMEAVRLQNRLKEYSFDGTDSSQNPGYTGEVSPDHN